MGVFPALREALDDSEDELSALASGAVGGGLALAVLGGLNGRTWAEERMGKRLQRIQPSVFLHTE